MKNVGWAALIGTGVALVAFIVDWALDHLDAPEEPEPLWPPDKPYSRMTYHTHWSTDDWVVGPGWADPDRYNKPITGRYADVVIIDDPMPKTWELP